MAKQPSSALEKYDDSKFTVLHPVMAIVEGEAVSPMLVESVSVVHVDPSPEGPDVYVAWWASAKDPRKLAPTAVLLRRVGIAAGARWATPNFHGGTITDPRTGHRRVLVTAEAAVRQVNGEWVSFPGTTEIDTAVLEEKWLNEGREKAEKAAGHKKGQPLPAEVEAQIRDSVRRRILAMKDNLVPMAESKAMNRALRGLLGIRQAYSVGDLRKPWVVPRMLYRPDVATAIEEGRRAVGELYGGSPGGPLGQDAPSSSLSTAEEPPRDQPVPAVEATDQTGPRGRGKAPEAEATTAGSPVEGPMEPSEDPLIEEAGPHRGERMSYIAEIDPAYLRGMLAATRAKKKRDLIEAWLSFAQPTQQSLGG